MKKYIILFSLIWGINCFAQDKLPSIPKIDSSYNQKIDSCKNKTIFYTSEDIKRAPAIKIAIAMKNQDKKEVERLKKEMFGDFYYKPKQIVKNKNTIVLRDSVSETFAKSLESLLNLGFESMEYILKTPTFEEQLKIQRKLEDKFINNFKNKK